MKKLFVLLLVVVPLVVGAQQDVAVVNSINGMLVFTDCVPLAEYDILGVVDFNGKGTMHMTNQSVKVGGNTYNYSSVYEDTPQYTKIRDGLIVQALLANRSCEGVILSIPTKGVAKATMIKFKEGVEHKDRARVKRFFGVYSFVDSEPLGSYDYLGRKGITIALSSNYGDLRDKMIKKLQKKGACKRMNGIIMHYVDGGTDTAEAILIR